MGMSGLTKELSLIKSYYYRFRTEKSQLILNWVGWLFALITVPEDYSHFNV